eukprot:GHVQ01001370.1.p1 GENE.GHVQ01001370.1~~GHVQ01001370.1.p1  ORF type:complete len:189 (+),score=27.95 GHVQ01001370.1:419-985(+)
MVRRMFLPYFSKDAGPPKIRMQLMGVRRKHFYKIVAANQRDPRDGKHMEVLGSYSPRSRSGVKEIRLRFSRIKFWLAVGSQFNSGMHQLLSVAGLIPTPPPRFGWRTKGHYTLLQQIIDKQAHEKERQLHRYYKTAYLQGIRHKQETSKDDGEDGVDYGRGGGGGGEHDDVESKKKRADTTKVHLILR